MSANPSQKETWFSAFTDSGSYGRNKFEPGKYINALDVASSTTANVEGQGYGAILIGNKSNMEVTASNGVSIPMAQFAVNTIYEIGIRQVKIGSTGTATLFKLNNAKGG